MRQLRAGGRVCTFYIGEEGGEREAQVQELLALVECLVRDHVGIPYSKDVYSLAHALARVHPEELRRQVAKSLAG